MGQHFKQIMCDKAERSQNKKTVIMACTQPYWSVLQVGSQHLARQFLKNGWNVHYISSPISPFHLPLLFKDEVLKRFTCAFQGSFIHENGSIISYIPFASIVPAGYPILSNEIITRKWYKTMFPTLNRLKKRISSNGIDLLYIDNLSYHFLLDRLSYKKSIFRVMDVHEGLPGWEDKARTLAAKIAKKADVTVYSALGLQKYVKEIGAERSVFVPNGIDFNAFIKNKNISSQRHLCLRSIPDPIILYTGIVDSRMDIPIIRKAAKSHPNVSFVFVGPVKQAGRTNDLPKNIYFTGPVPHSELALIMGDVKAGMIPFDVKNRMNLIQGIRPLKLFEYMAAGLPVITARWPELEKMDSPAWIYDDEKDFSDLITRAVQNNRKLEPVKEFAKQHDWKKSYQIMVSSLEK